MPNPFQGPSPAPNTRHDSHLAFHPNVRDHTTIRRLIARSPETLEDSPWLAEGTAFVHLVEGRKPFMMNDHNSEGKFLLKRMAHKIFDWLLKNGHFVLCTGSSSCVDLRPLDTSKQEDIDLINAFRSKIEQPILPAAFEWSAMMNRSRIVDAAHMYLQSFFVDIDEHPFWAGVALTCDWNDHSLTFPWVAEFIKEVRKQPWGRPFQPLVLGHPICIRNLNAKQSSSSGQT